MSAFSSTGPTYYSPRLKPARRPWYHFEGIKFRTGLRGGLDMVEDPEEGAVLLECGSYFDEDQGCTVYFVDLDSHEHWGQLVITVKGKVITNIERITCSQSKQCTCSDCGGMRE